MSHIGQERADALAKVLAADSLTSAQFAASELIDRALPGGAALDLSARPLVELMGEPDTRLARSSYRAYGLAVLCAMGTWIGSWRRAAAPNPSLTASVREEALIEEALARFCSLELELLDDPDGEVRSLMSVLVGSVGDARMAEKTLLARYGREESDVVRAFIVQGLIRVLGRLPTNEGADLERELAQILEDAPPAVLGRARHELDGAWRTAKEREQMLRRVEVPARPVELVRWPAEEV